MARLASVLFIIAFAAAAFGQATTACPWVTYGTAERLLGGETTVIVRVAGNAAGSCSFLRGSGDSAASIEILVGAVDTHPCPRGSVKLKALGNEAVQCGIGTQPSRNAEIIAGRVRDIYFAVTITGIPGVNKQEPADPRLVDGYGASAIEGVAEQVVGNLY